MDKVSLGPEKGPLLVEIQDRSTISGLMMGERTGWSCRVSFKIWTGLIWLGAAGHCIADWLISTTPIPRGLKVEIEGCAVVLALMIIVVMVVVEAVGAVVLALMLVVVVEDGDIGDPGDPVV